MPTFRARYTAMEKKAFGRSLRKLMEDKSMTGAELARQASLKLPAGKTIGRDNISWYLNGRSIPTAPTLTALAKVLEVDPAFLLPRMHSQKVGEPAEPLASDNRTVQMSTRPDGTMDLMLKVNLPKDLGWKILQMVESDKPSPPPKSR